MNLFFRIRLVTILIIIAIITLAGCGQDERSSPVDAVSGASPDPYETGTFQTLNVQRAIVIHCGNSMRPAAEEIADAFQKRYNIGARFNFGGSSQLLPAIELGQQGDLYICHDPYAVILEQKNLMERYETVGYLEPIIIVPGGNPNKLTSLADLARPGLRIAIPDPRYATAGQLVQQAVGDKGIETAFAKNLKMEGRGHNDIAMAVLTGQVDAGVVWNFISVFYSDRLELISTGIEFPDTRVTICLLKNAKDREAAEKFINMAASEHGQQVFIRHGYARLRDRTECIISLTEPIILPQHVDCSH